MAKLTKWFWLTVVALFTSAALAQAPEPRARGMYSQPELDQMLAPIALYPDSLLSQVLMAATYPRDVAEAASWSRANGRLSGDQAVRAVEREPWDPSVISLAAFPEVLEMMDERMDWTERLGDAFIAQQNQVMDTVQDLRRRADAAGNLRSSDEMVVQRQGYDYVIEPPAPDVVYVPYYDPNLVYGTWWWPQYEPIYWRPWAGYRYHAGYRGFGWGYGIHLGHGFFFGAFDWPRRYLGYSNHRPWYYHGRDYRSGARWTPRWERRGDRDGRWRDGDRSGSRDGRWRDGDRSGTRDGRWRDRDGRGDRRVQSPQPGSTTSQQGFFPPRIEGQAAQSVAPGNPAVRPVTPRTEAARSAARAPVAIPEGAAPVRTERTAPVRTERAAIARPERVTPVQPQRVERGSSVERPATSRAPVERQAAPQRAERAERAERPEREERAERSNPVERSSSGRGGRER